MDGRWRGIDIGRLGEKIINDRQALLPFRSNRLEMVRETAGHRYGDNGARQKVKLNLMSLFQSTVGRNLISKSPRVYLTTPSDDQVSTVSAMETWCNREIERQRLAEVFGRIVIDAMYGPGIAKICLATPADAATTAWNQQAGKARIQRIDLDDFVYDTNAHDLSEAEYIGHRFRVPVRVAKAMYGRNAQGFEEMGSPDYNRDGDERIGQLTRSHQGFYELEDHVELWEIYLPHHRCVVVLSQDAVIQTGRDGVQKPLWYQKWVGRDSGPYEILSLGIVSGSAMPKAPMMDLFDIHLDVQNAKRKANETLRDIKELTGYRRQNDIDGKAVKNAKHLDMVALDDPGSVAAFMTGGRSWQMLNQGALQGKEDFSFMGANLELLGGRSQQAGTATQEELLQQNSNASIADMQERTAVWLEKCLKSFCWYGWHDPYAVHDAPLSIPGTPPMIISRKIYPADHPDPTQRRRTGNFNDLGLKLVAFSAQPKSPQQTLAFMTSVVDKMMPMMPLLQQQGIVIDLNFLLTEMGKLGDCPDLHRLFKTQEPPQPAEGESDELPHDTLMPSSTTRTNVRKNVSERTQGGSDRQLIAAGMDLDLGGSPKNGVAA